MTGARDVRRPLPEPVELALMFAEGAVAADVRLRALPPGPGGCPGCGGCLGGEPPCAGPGLVVGDARGVLGVAACSRVERSGDTIALTAYFAAERPCTPRRIRPVYCRPCPIAAALRISDFAVLDQVWQTVRFPVVRHTRQGERLVFEYKENCRTLWPTGRMAPVHPGRRP